MEFEFVHGRIVLKIECRLNVCFFILLVHLTCNAADVSLSFAFV